jgi:hypothetical protein
VQAKLFIKQDSISKITNTKRAGTVAQVVECLPSNTRALVQPQYHRSRRGGGGEEGGGGRRRGGRRKGRKREEDW